MGTRQGAAPLSSAPLSAAGVQHLCACGHGWAAEDWRGSELERLARPLQSPPGPWPGSSCH
eukprot:7365355-Pyramimonas_sp.AAC.1